MNPWHTMHVCKHLYVFVFSVSSLSWNHILSFWFLCGIPSMNSWHAMHLCKHLNVFIFCQFAFVKPYSNLLLFMWAPIDEFVTCHAPMQTFQCCYFICAFSFKKPYSNLLIYMWVPSVESMTRDAPKQTFKCFYCFLDSHSWKHIPSFSLLCGFQSMNPWHAMPLWKHLNVLILLWVPIRESIFQPFDFYAGS